MRHLEMFGDGWPLAIIAVLWIFMVLLAIYVWSVRMNTLVNPALPEQATAEEPSWKIWAEALVVFIAGFNAPPADSSTSPPVAGLLALVVLTLVGLTVAYLRKLITKSRTA